MEIVDLSEKYEKSYFCCLEDWSDQMKEAGNHKETWYQKMKERGLKVKIATVDDKPAGMIHYYPIEFSPAEGKNLYFVACIWVHGYKQGQGNFQKRGIGTALLSTAEEDVKKMGKKGMVVWGISLPFFMRASWFKKHGYLKVDNNGGLVLLWKKFSNDAVQPRWVKIKKKPDKTSDVVIVSSFLSGWCPSMNTVFERTKRAASEIGSKIVIKEYSTLNREVFHEWGINDGIFINDKELRSGPPPSYEKIKRKLEKAVKKIK